jgi:DNA-cytosine methyltransferase
MRLITLFSGVGCTEYGLQAALEHLKLTKKYKVNVVNFCEIDKRVAEAFSIMHDVPLNRNLGDITKVDLNKLKKNVGKIDLLISSFPCQSFSNAGGHKGFDHKQKGSLFDLSADMIEVVRPKVALFENVKGILNKKFGAMKRIETRMNAIGYNITWKIMNGIDSGVPQARQRWICVCTRAKLGKDAFTFPSPRTVTGRRPTVADYVDLDVTDRSCSTDMIPHLARYKDYVHEDEVSSSSEEDDYSSDDDDDDSTDDDDDDNYDNDRPARFRPTKNGIVKLWDGCADGTFKHGFTGHRIFSIHGTTPTFTLNNDAHFAELGGKLTTDERWALMSLPSEGLAKLRKEASFKVSNAFVHAVCGNGIVVNVMEDVFVALFKQKVL